MIKYINAAIIKYMTAVKNLTLWKIVVKAAWNDTPGKNPQTPKKIERMRENGIRSIKKTQKRFNKN